MKIRVSLSLLCAFGMLCPTTDICRSKKNCDNLCKEEDPLVYEADYVVVGMGAAGAGLAKLLSDNHRNSVIGIEAGADHDNDTPITDSTYAPVLEDDYFPQYFYQFSQIVQDNAPEVEFNYTTGRMLGGGSSINGEQYVQGSKQLYQEWEDLLGHFWSTERIREAFMSYEKFNGETTCQVERGYTGPVNIRQAPTTATSMATKFVDATVAATGFNQILDYNCSNTPMGPFTQWQLFQNPNGSRASSSTAYLKPVLNSHLESKGKRKFKVLDKTTVLRVIFDGHKATGVKILQNGRYGTVYAKKKVILCAGVYSPWLLQISGIGPKETLQNAGVHVLVDNPNVGKNLVNQFLSMALFTANPNDVGVPVDDPSALYVGGAFLPDPTVPVDQNRRGIQLIGLSPEQGSFAIGIINVQPKSRGVLNIQSKDPLQIPLVDDAAFADPADLATFMNAYRDYIVAIADQLHAIDPLYNLVMPTLDMINDDAELEEYITSTVDHTHHWTGTCIMAPRDQGGVVDKYGQVYGVKHLIVADDTIAPFIPDGNTAACAFMIAARIADHILSEDN